MRKIIHVPGFKWVDQILKIAKKASCGLGICIPHEIHHVFYINVVDIFEGLVAIFF